MKKMIIGLIGIMGVLLFTAQGTISHPQQVLEAFVEGRSTQEVVSLLEDSKVGGDVLAKAFPDRIELHNEENVLNLNVEAFYVSIAPYLHETHPCTIHNFPGCQAELVNEDVYVQITDNEGIVYFDGIQQTYQNGFMGFWLPKDKTYSIQLAVGDYSGNYTFSTFSNDPTCLTEFKLERLMV